MDVALWIDICLQIGKAIPVTLELTVVSFILALILAVTVAVVEYFNIPVLKQIGNIYVSFFRGTPQIPQIFLLYFGIPSIIPSLRDISPFIVCIIALTLNSGAYMKEVVRGALLAVPNGQKEAALAHGMTQRQAMFRIVLPQATRVAVPSLFNNLVDTIKGSSLAFTVGVIEMTAAAKLKAAVTFDYFAAYVILMLMYWAIILLLERVEKNVEKKLAHGYER